MAATAQLRSVVSLPSSLYLDGSVTSGGATVRGGYRAGVWFDISAGAMNASNHPLLLGGETSMWSDQYLPGRKGLAPCLLLVWGLATLGATTPAATVTAPLALCLDRKRSFDRDWEEQQWRCQVMMALHTALVRAASLRDMACTASLSAARAAAPLPASAAAAPPS